MHKRRRNTHGSESYISRLVQVARAYYLDNQIQSEIARYADIVKMSGAKME